jgi:hypothetical protein
MNLNWRLCIAGDDDCPLLLNFTWTLYKILKDYLKNLLNNWL